MWWMAALAAVGAASGYNQNRAAANIAGYNAELNEIQGRAAVEAARVEEGRKRRSNARFFGEFNVARAKSGVEASGTYLNVLEDATQEAELDALMIRYNGQLAKLGYDQQASLNRLQQRSLDDGLIWQMLGGAMSGAAAGAGVQSGMNAKSAKK